MESQGVCPTSEISLNILLTNSGVAAEILVDSPRFSLHRTTYSNKSQVNLNQLSSVLTGRSCLLVEAQLPRHSSLKINCVSDVVGDRICLA